MNDGHADGRTHKHADRIAVQHEIARPKQRLANFVYVNRNKKICEIELTERASTAVHCTYTETSISLLRRISGMMIW